MVNSESDLPPDPTLPQSLKSVRIIAFAFILNGSVTEPAYRGGETFDRLVSNLEGFRQRVFQASPSASKVFSPVGGIPSFQSRKEPSEVFGEHPKHATGFALTLRVRRAGLESPLE